MALTLTVEEILSDVIDAFKVKFPIITKMSTNFTPDSLKLDKTYDAHLASLPSITEYDESNGGYQANAEDVRSLLEDVPVTVDQHPKVSLKARHLAAIADDKQEYDKVIAGAGFVIGKNMLTNIVGKFTSRNISQASTYTTANSDYDAVENIRDDMNIIGASPMGRHGIVNTPVAGALQLDDRVLSADYRGEMNGANAFRRFQNCAGFEEIVEYPELSTNNGTAVAISGIEADDEIITTAAAHELVVGDRVVFTDLTSGAGLADDGTIYHVVSVPSTTTLTVSATAGGSAVNVTTDYDGGNIGLVENLTGLFFEPRAVAIISGVPDDFDAAAQLFGAPPTYDAVTYQDPETGLTLVGIAEVQNGTLNGFLHITHVFGCSVGSQGGDDGALTDYAGHRLISA
jgi:hypothetical protein